MKYTTEVDAEPWDGTDNHPKLFTSGVYGQFGRVRMNMSPGFILLEYGDYIVDHPNGTIEILGGKAFHDRFTLKDNQK